MFNSSPTSSSPCSISFCPRYDSEGKYLDSLPDLATPRRSPGCTSFLTSNGEQVKISTFCPILFLLISNRPCLLLEVLVWTMSIYQALSCSQMENGLEEETFPGENIGQIIKVYHRYHCNCRFHNQLYAIISPVL